ncbi:ORF1 [Torque teno equus virus 1]|uniref:Capsid protein n=1 Tax=Torque teno equus virus 1 TaxID=1673633 RepID=A0A0H4AQ58_9VIRU|nr:ORF1 [Torque teno equus virus 1]AKN50611.1 ORF1 [Torque teno equus virus 1]
MAWTWNRRRWYRRRGYPARRRYYRRRRYWRRRRPVRRRRRRRRFARRIFRRGGRRGGVYRFSAWNPTHMRKLTISTLGRLLTVSPGYEYLNYKPVTYNNTLNKEGKPVESGIGLAAAGGWTYGFIDLKKLYKANKKLMAHWSTSNKGFDLWRYFGSVIYLWPNEMYDYVFWYDKEWTSEDWLEIKEYCHPLVMFNAPKKILVRSTKWGRKRPKRIFIKPPAFTSTQWQNATIICGAPLFQYAVTVIELTKPYTHDGLVKHDWYASPDVPGSLGPEPEWLNKWGHIQPPGHCLYMQKAKNGVVTWADTSRQGTTTQQEKYTGVGGSGTTGYGPKFSDKRVYIDYDMETNKQTNQGKTFDWWWSKEKQGIAWNSGIRGVAIRKAYTMNDIDYWVARVITADETRGIWDTGDNPTQPKALVQNAEYTDPRQQVRWGPFCAKTTIADDWDDPPSIEDTMSYDIVCRVKSYFQIGGQTLPPSVQVDDPCNPKPSGFAATMLHGRCDQWPGNSTLGQLQSWMVRRGIITDRGLEELTKQSEEPSDSDSDWGRHPRSHRSSKRKEKKRKRKAQETSESESETSESITSATETEESQVGRNRIHHRQRDHQHKLDRKHKRLRMKSKSTGDLYTTWGGNNYDIF